MTSSRVGKLICSWRVIRGMTQEELAIKAGFKGKGMKASISRMENGQYEPQLRTLRKIAKALRVKPEELLQ